MQSGAKWGTFPIELKHRTGVMRFLPLHHLGPFFSFFDRDGRKGTRQLAFRGQYKHSLDGKGRLTVPAKFRKELADRAVVVKGPDNCLWLMPEKAFSSLSDQYISPHSPLSGNARAIRRLFNSTADEGELDSAGRVKIPKNLIEKASLDGPCTVVGAGEYLEIWNTDEWTKIEAELDASFAEIAEGMSGAAE
ncbi:MAG: division/cell wall cluster transcriptional repressor MraZ [Solirubrobacterales bacterium]